MASEIVQEVIRSATKEAAKETLKETAEQVAKHGAKKIVNEVGKKAASEVAKKAVTGVAAGTMDCTFKMALKKAGTEEAVAGILKEITKKGVNSHLGKEIAIEVSEEIGGKLFKEGFLAAGCGAGKNGGKPFLQALAGSGGKSAVSGLRIRSVAIDAGIVVVCFSWDVYQYSQGNKTATEVVTNTVVNSVSVVTGILGALVGQAVIPIPGVGSLVGGVVGGVLGSVVTGGAGGALKSKSSCDQ